MVLEVKDLSFRYPDGTLVFESLNLTLEAGRVALLGHNGSGKSTLSALVCGALEPTGGEIRLDGHKLERHQRRHAFGMVFQDPDDQLFMATVLEDVGFNLVAHGMARHEADRLARAQLEALDIAHLADRPPHRLSGGEKRMTALAGALVARPRMMLFDEPSSALDPKARRRLIAALQTLTVPFLMTTHDLDLALDTCDRALVLCRGVVSANESIELLGDAERLARWDLELPLRYQK